MLPVFDDLQRDRIALQTTGSAQGIDPHNHGCMRYTYTVDDQNHAGCQILAEHSPTGPIRVAYDPAHPEISTLTRFGALDSRPVPVLFFLAISFAAFLQLRRFIAPPVNPYDR